MKHKRWWFAVVVAATVLASVAAGPAHATFPGANGLIAFMRPDHGRNDIFTMSPDGTGISRLTHMAPDHQAVWPAWSPDGSQIVFERVNARWQHNQIWIMSADGSNPHRLFPDPWFTDQTPSFSPDGTKVLFSRCQDDPPPADQGRCAIATINVNGTGITRLTDPPAEELAYWPKYSPDGTQIAFTVYYSRGVRAGVFVMEADGSNVHLVTPPKLRPFLPDWAPDGSRLVFASNCCVPKPSAIWSVKPDGSGLTRVTTPIHTNDNAAAYAPDGTRIVFERDRTDGPSYGVFTMNPDGTGITRVLNKAWGPAWQPVVSAVSGR